MVVRVAQQAQQSGAAQVWVATDDARIVAAVEAHGQRALLTRADHSTGTDRLAEVVNLTTSTLSRLRLRLLFETTTKNLSSVNPDGRAR